MGKCTRLRSGQAGILDRLHGEYVLLFNEADMFLRKGQRLTPGPTH
jgi:hypothetical protein